MTRKKCVENGERTEQSCSLVLGLEDEGRVGVSGVAGRVLTGAGDCVNWHRDLPELYNVARKTNPEENWRDTCNTLAPVDAEDLIDTMQNARNTATHRSLHGVFRP
jgi:hypothetical protein